MHVVDGEFPLLVDALRSCFPPALLLVFAPTKSLFSLELSQHKWSLRRL